MLLPPFLIIKIFSHIIMSLLHPMPLRTYYHHCLLVRMVRSCSHPFLRSQLFPKRIFQSFFRLLPLVPNFLLLPAMTTSVLIFIMRIQVEGMFGGFSLRKYSTPRQNRTWYRCWCRAAQRQKGFPFSVSTSRITGKKQELFFRIWLRSQALLLDAADFRTTCCFTSAI